MWARKHDDEPDQGFRRKSTRRRGAALLVALALISLVAVLAVALLWGGLAARKIQGYTAPAWGVRGLEDFAAEILVGQLREEARRTAEELPVTGPGKPRWFQPTSPDTVRLNRDVPKALQDARALQQVLWISHAGSAREALASSPLPLSAPARDGAVDVSGSALNAARLLPNDNALPADSVDWLLLSREGPLPGITDLHPDMRRRSGSPREVIGRMAFVIHDLSGRLDANVFLAQLPADRLQAEERRLADQRRAGKGRLQSADLAILPALSSGSEKVPPLFVDDRAGRSLRIAANGRLLPGGSGSWKTWQTVEDRLRPTFPPGVVDVTGSRFFSRQNFLFRAGQPGSGLPDSAAGAFSTFSRAPRRIVANSGNELSRLTPFSLQHLHLLSFRFPVGAEDDPERQAAIRERFGLSRSSDQEAWTYEPTGLIGSETLILPLEEVWELDPPRPPNFFEMLKAALEPGSLGQHAEGTAAREAYLYDRHKDLQILKIGANIIDQWDRDSFPTRIRITHTALPETEVEIAGIENLPLVSKVHFDCINPLWGIEGVALEDRRLLPYVFPELWNPHQPPPNLPGAAAPGSPAWTDQTAPQAGPRKIRLRLLGGVRLEMRSENLFLEANQKRRGLVEHLNMGLAESYLEIDDQSLRNFAVIPQLVRHAHAEGLFHNGDLHYHGTPVTKDDDNGIPKNHIPFTDFFGARLVVTPGSQDIADACFSGAPVPKPDALAGNGGPPIACSRFIQEDQELFVYRGLRIPHGIQDTLIAPYVGFDGSDESMDRPITVEGKHFAKEHLVWRDELEDRKILKVTLPRDGLDVVLEYQDHNGNWQTYSRFACQNLIGREFGVGSDDDRVYFHLYDGQLFERDPDPEDSAVRKCFDNQGSATFFKSDPRTPRLGVSRSIEALSAERPVTLSRPQIGDPGSPGRGLRSTTIGDAALGKQALEGLQVIVPNPKLPFWPEYFPALLGENLDWSRFDPAQAKTETFARDPDGLARPADGWLLRHVVDARNGVSPGDLGDEQWARERAAFGPATNQAAMPVILNRPFRSLAELGVVHRDQPWKTLDLHSPLSGDAGLLRFFTLDPPMEELGDNAAPLRAGVIDLDAADDDTLVALLTGTELAPPQQVVSWLSSPFDPEPVSGPVSPTISQLPGVSLDEADAREIVRRFRAYRREHAGSDPADLITHFARMTMGDPEILSPALPPAFDPAQPATRSIHPQPNNLPVISGGQSTAFSVIDHEREAPLKALADVQQVGSWNLFVDLFVESGFYPPGSRDLADFHTQARHRTWHRIAIDRFTGQILAWEREVVYE